MTQPDDAAPFPDGPTPDREQLPLPRRDRQSHLDPQLRNPGGTGAGTPFTAFAAEATDPGRPAPADRAAAFHAGAHRGRGATGPHRRGTGRHRSER